MKKNTSPYAVMLDVTKHYDGPHGGTRALKNISFEAFPGELILLLGPSGSGKTTFLTLMAGLQGPTSGEILLFGQKTTSYTNEALQELRAKRLGFVFQTFLLLDALTILENVTLVQQFVHAGKIVAKKNALTMLERFGIKHLSDKYPAQISQGEKQRVALARALVNGADLIFADEPTGNLASGQGMQIIEYLRDIAHHDQKCILITSHDERISAFADRVYRMLDGELIREK